LAWIAVVLPGPNFWSLRIFRIICEDMLWGIPSSETEVKTPHKCNYLINHTHLLMLRLKTINGNIAAAGKAAHVPNKKCQFENVTENVEPEH